MNCWCKFGTSSGPVTTQQPSPVVGLPCNCPYCQSGLRTYAQHPVQLSSTIDFKVDGGSPNSFKNISFSVSVPCQLLAEPSLSSSERAFCFLDAIGSCVEGKQSHTTRLYNKVKPLEGNRCNNAYGLRSRVLFPCEWYSNNNDGDAYRCCTVALHFRGIGSAPAALVGDYGMQLTSSNFFACFYSFSYIL